MDLTITHRSTVTEDQIDHLGHMNVRYYGVNARQASDALLASLGSTADLEIVPVAVYTRHLREQLLGASLAVHTGVLDVGTGWLRAYHELRNVDTEDVAATFIHRFEARPVEPGAGWPPQIPALGFDALPAHGRPRSIDLDTDPIASAPELDVLRDRGLAIRLPRKVEAEECGAAGRVSIEDAQFLIWGGEPIDDSHGPMLQDGPDGAVIGWAAMENRVCVHRLPEAGATIQSFSATIDVADKTTRSAMWAYDVERGELLVTFEGVSLAFDTVTRRAVSIPPELREARAALLQPDLAPSRRA